MKYKYTAVLKPMEDSKGYYAHVPDLPGRVTSGANLREAIEMIIDAASIWLVCAEDEGITIPTSTSASQSEWDAGAILSEIDIDTAEYRDEIADLPLDSLG